MSPLEQSLTTVTPSTEIDDRPIVWICTPLRTFDGAGEMTQEIFEGLRAHHKEPIRQLGNAQTLPWKFQLCMVGGGGVARARNYIVSQFLKSKATYLFWKDYDLMPTAQDYITILSTMKRRSLPVVGGLYTIRSEDGHWVINFPSALGPDPEGVLWVLELGTGFKCYHRSAFEAVCRRNPWMEYHDDDHKENEWGLFSMGPIEDRKFWSNVPTGRRWLTEDYWLDYWTREADIPIIVDTNVKLRHWDEDSDKIFPKEFPIVPQRDQAAIDAAEAEGKKKLATV